VALAAVAGYDRPCMLTKTDLHEASFAFDPSGGDILAFAVHERMKGRPAAIVTLIYIDGSSPRALGAQMAVAADGRFTGSITSGCLERAIIDEARNRMASGEGGVVRYGKGSQYLDVVLPCGSGVDLLFTINPSAEMLSAPLDRWTHRQPASVVFTETAALSHGAVLEKATQQQFVRHYLPPLRIVAAGVGAELVLLSRIAKASGYAVCAISPDASTLEQCAADEIVHLQSTAATPEISIDEWSAFVFLFHDREWELSLAPQILQSKAFYVGAVGSPRTHEARLAALRDIGVDRAVLDRLNGPIGLIPATRDPAALSVSVLAGVLAAWPHAPE